MSLKVHISPTAAQVRDTDGVGRVVLAQHKWLPEQGIELVADPNAADVIAAHITGDGLPRVDVLSLHGLYWTGDPNSGIYSRWHSDANQKILAAARAAKAITVPSDWVAGPFLRDMRLQPTVIGHGIEVDDWEPADEHKGYVLWNKNRSGDSCNPAPAVDLARRGVKVVTTFAPGGDRPSSLYVTGTLPHADMKQLVRHAEAYLATTKETFGIGTLEAMAAGVPVLGYDWGGTADLVRHQATGYLVKPGDIDGLMEGLAYIRKHRARLSEASREVARLYDWRAVAADYAALYRQVAEPEPSGVTVVITAYNYAEFVGEAIESCLNQTRKPDEIIVIDDGSTDDTQAILSRYDGIQVITQSNRGVAAARNAGVARATGAFIVCLDGDDALDARYLETCLSDIHRDRSLGIVYTGLSLLGTDGALAPNAWPPQFDWEAQATPHVPPTNCIPSAAMFRKTMWERAGGYKQVYAPGEDAEFWTRGLSVGFTARRVTDEGLFHYRVGHQSASRSKQYRPIDVWHPWMRDKQFPMAAPARVQPLVRSYSEPAVSVVIPCGPGHAKYLPAAIDSLLGQTCRDWEVIVINDSGGEDLPLVTYPFVRFIDIGQANGVAEARNEGLSFARAPLVLFLDADDFLLPTALDAMLKAHLSSDGKYVYTDWIAVNGDTQETHASPEWTRDGWLHGGLHAVTALIPTAWARDVGGFDQELPGWEDWDFFIKLTIAGYCGVRVPEPLLAYRQHTGGRRQESFDNQTATKAILAERYGAYKTGEKQMPGCCGGNGDAILAVKRALGEGEQVQSLTMAADLPDGDARMEFIGEQMGAVTFFGSEGRQYRGGNNPHDRYANVHRNDVERLVNTGRWRDHSTAPGAGTHACRGDRYTRASASA
jgi:glycosyltransferase involved in cell wall biosynthesis